MRRLSYFFIAVLFACSPVKGTPLIDADVITIDSLKVTPPTVALELGMSSPMQLAVTATLSDGTTRDVSPYVTWSSSDATVATAQLGDVTAVGSGNATITASLDDQTGSAAVSVTDATLIVTSVAVGSIEFFDATAGSNTPPLRTISGAATGLGFVWSAVPVGDELYVTPNAFTTGGISVFPLDGSGNIAPTRTISGATTGLTTAYTLAVFNNEIYVASIAGVISVFPADGSGDIAPTRTISGSNTGMTSVVGLAIHNNLIYVANAAPPLAILAFPLEGSGNIAPVQTITGPASNLVEPSYIAFAGSDMYVADGDDHPPGSVLVYPEDANGSDVAPIRWLHGPDTQLVSPIELALIGQSMVVVNYAQSTVPVLPLEGTEDVAPLRVLEGSASGINEPRGISIY